MLFHLFINRPYVTMGTEHLLQNQPETIIVKFGRIFVCTLAEVSRQ